MRRSHLDGTHSLRCFVPALALALNRHIELMLPFDAGPHVNQHHLERSHPISQILASRAAWAETQSQPQPTVNQPHMRWTSNNQLPDLSPWPPATSPCIDTLKSANASLLCRSGTCS